MTSDKKPGLALFDLDHTLIPIDSDYAWGEITTTLGWTDPVEFGRRNDEFFAHYRAGTLDINDYVRFATDAVRAKGPDAAAKAHARFMLDVVQPVITDAARELIAQHRAAGDEIVIVTAVKIAAVPGCLSASTNASLRARPPSSISCFMRSNR